MAMKWATTLGMKGTERAHSKSPRCKDGDDASDGEDAYDSNEYGLIPWLPRATNKRTLLVNNNCNILASLHVPVTLSTTACP